MQLPKVPSTSVSLMDFVGGKTVKTTQQEENYTMAKKSKKYLEAAKKIDSSKAYSVEEAIALAKETGFR